MLTLTNPTALAIATTVVLLLCALVFWAAVQAIRAVARLSHTAGETARELDRLTRRLDEIAGSPPRRGDPRRPEDSDSDATPPA